MFNSKRGNNEWLYQNHRLFKKCVKSDVKLPYLEFFIVSYVISDNGAEQTSILTDTAVGVKSDLFLVILDIQHAGFLLRIYQKLGDSAMFSNLHFL